MFKISNFIIFFLFICNFLIFSQEFNLIIDEYINNKDLAGLDNYLKINKKNENYSDIESYILSKTKSLLLEDDYEFSKSILKILLTNNLNNKELQAIYLSLNTQIKERKLDEQKAKQELTNKNKDLAKREKERLKKEKDLEKKRKEEERIEQAKKEKIRKEKEKQENEQVKKEKKEEEKEKITKIIPSFGLDNFSLSWNLGALDFIFYQSQYYNEYYDTFKPNFSYGISADLDFYCHLPFLITGIDAYFDTYFVNFTDQNTTEIYYKILSATTTPYIKVPLYIRAGIAQLINYSDKSKNPDVFLRSFITPVIGLRIKNYYFNKIIGIDGSIDYYLITFFTSKMDAAFDTSFGILFRVYQKKKISLMIRSDIIGTFIISDGKLENSLKLQISFGMGINEK